MSQDTFTGTNPLDTPNVLSGRRVATPPTPSTLPTAPPMTEAELKAAEAALTTTPGVEDTATEAEESALESSSDLPQQQEPTLNSENNLRPAGQFPAEALETAIEDEQLTDKEHTARMKSDNDITHGLGFLESMTELHQQLQELQQLRMESEAAKQNDDPKPAQTGWLGKTFKSALQSAIQPKNSLDSEASLAAYDEELSLWAEYFHYSYLLREIVRTSTDWQRVLCVMASKGGAGKTPLIAYLAAVFAFATSTTNLLLEANENDGTLNDQLAVSRSSQPLLNTIVANHSLVANHQIATSKLGKFSQTSLWALLSAANSDENDFSMPEFLAMFDVVRPHFCNVWGDTGNGNRRAANEGIFLESDVVLFPALATKAVSWSRVITTMINLYQAGHHKKLQACAMIVINATKASEGHSVKQFLEVFREEARKQVEPRYNHKTNTVEAPLWTTDGDELLRDIGFAFDPITNELTGGNLYLVRHSDGIHNGNVTSVRPDDTGLGTIVDYLKILIAAFTMPTQDLTEKKSEIDRRIKGREDTPISTQEAMFNSFMANNEGGSLEAMVIDFAAHVEKLRNKTAEPAVESSAE